MNWLKSAVTAEDGKTYEGAYLALVAVIALVVLTVVIMLLLAGIEMFLCNREVKQECFNPAGVGGGIAAIVAAVGAFLGGVGAYILMDKKQQFAPPGSFPAQKIEEVETKKTTTTVAAPPGPSDETDPENPTGAIVKPLSPKITKADVGKRVAIVKPKPKK